MMQPMPMISEKKKSRMLNARCWLISAVVTVLIFIILLSIGGHVPAPRLPWDADLLKDVANGTFGFEKILVINLPSRTDKRDAMSLAAGLTGVEVEFVDGVTEVNSKALPPGGATSGRTPGEIGNWRAHLNAVHRVVEQNLSSALIMEDDADWDVRIKSQLQDFATASRVLLQPLRGTSDRYLDPSYPHPREGQDHTDFKLEDEKRTTPPTTSPYGDLNNWDLLWLGHCGSGYPLPPDASKNPLGRVVIPNDPTVPETQHIDPQFGDRGFLTEYGNHTRIVSRARGNLCMLAYAISQQGARKILYELGIHAFTGPTDLMFRQICDEEAGRTRMTCLSVMPKMFGQHRPEGDKTSISDISGAWHGESHLAYTRNIRWSTHLNFAKLLTGRTDYVDLFRDGEDAIDLGGLR